MFAKLIGCKYMCNYSVSQIFFQIERKSVGIVGLEGHHKIAANGYGLAMWRHLKIVSPVTEVKFMDKN